MLNEITIGQYFPGNSVIHRLDPRMKVVLTFAYIVAVFIPQNWLGMLLVAAYLGLVIALSRISLKMIWKSVKPILPIILITAILNMFYVKGDVLVSFWVFTITLQGIITAVFIAVRIVCLIAGSAMLTYTVTPTALTDAMERLLSPLAKIRFPAHELSMMMTIALRFIPTLIEETEKIMSAQKARGADVESGGIIRRIKALIPILVPLFVSSFRRAYELATAMECRCYHGKEGRTSMKRYSLGRADFVALAITILLFGGMIAANILLPHII